MFVSHVVLSSFSLYLFLDNVARETNLCIFTIVFVMSFIGTQGRTSCAVERSVIERSRNLVAKAADIEQLTIYHQSASARKYVQIYVEFENIFGRSEEATVGTVGVAFHDWSMSAEYCAWMFEA